MVIRYIMVLHYSYLKVIFIAEANYKMKHYEKISESPVKNTWDHIRQLTGLKVRALSEGKKHLAGQYQAAIDDIRSVMNLNKLKADFLRKAARYFSECNEMSGQAAGMIQIQLKKIMSKEDFRKFINQAAKIFKRGKVKSKSLLTLLNILDKNTSIEYNPVKLNSSLKEPTEKYNNKILDLYERFHHFKPSKVETVDLKMSESKDGVLHVMKLGMMPEMVYISDKDINDTGSREKVTYIHKFRQYLPIYTDGNVFIIPAEKQDITDRGILFNGKKKVINPSTKRRDKKEVKNNV